MILAPAGLRADQIGIVVADIDLAMHRYGRLFGCGDWRVYTYGPAMLRDPTFRGRPGRFEMRLALASSDPQIELIQPLTGPSLYHEWMADHGEGLHHVGTIVPDLTAAIRDMGHRGFAVLQSGRGYGLDGDGGFAYLDTAAELGIVVELIEVPARRRQPDAVVRA
jgi:methylmalonyl-CoA/ethylmalonyl-CoA epimerase